MWGQMQNKCTDKKQSQNIKKKMHMQEQIANKKIKRCATIDVRSGRKKLKKKLVGGQNMQKKNASKNVQLQSCIHTHIRI